MRFFIEWGGGCLWSGDDVTRRTFGYDPHDELEPCPLPLSLSTIERCRLMAEWHDNSLNQTYPPDPGPWRQEECDRFNTTVFELLSDIRRELGSNFEVVDMQQKAAEDPELDAYLENPKNFRRTL